MALFLGLYLGHILGDFVFQPGRLVIAKREHLSAAVLHSAIVTTCTALSLARALSLAWPAVAIAGVAHLAVEQLSIGARRNPRSTGLTIFLLDQGLHILSLAMIAMLTSVTIPPVFGAWSADLATLAGACAVSTAAFGGSILVFEVQKALSGTEQQETVILGLDGARLYGMAERGAAVVGALLLPVPILGALAFAPRLAYALVSKGHSRSGHFTAAAVGLGLAVAGWVLVTSVVSLAR